MPPQTRIRRAGIEDAETAPMVAALSGQGGPAPHFDAGYRRDGWATAAL
jgi:hypothetical protein